MPSTSANRLARAVCSCGCLLAVALASPGRAPAQQARVYDRDRAAAHAVGDQLYQAVYLTHPNNGTEASATLYRVLYYMNAITQMGGSLGMEFTRIAETTDKKDRNWMLENQLMVDFGVASEFGLLTPANLTCLQAGVAPTATLGPSAGKRINVVKIRPADIDSSLVNAALCAEGSPIHFMAYFQGNGPAPDGRFAGRRIQAPATALATTASSTNLRTPPPTPAPYRMPNGAMVYPGTSQGALTNYASQNLASRVQLDDLAFNAMLPVDLKIKLGIARVEGNEITVAILGRQEVILQGPVGGKNTSHPSVEKVKVSKTNPVRLPGVSANAYLIYTLPAGPQGQEIRWYFVDTNVDNGMVFRIARVVGPL